MELAKSMAREIGNKTREFYEFVLPPVDMRLEDDNLVVIIDMPGFDKKNVKLSLETDILSIQACKEIPENDVKVICNQRPNVIDKKLRLPVIPSGDGTNAAKYENGILTVTIPIQKNSQDINIE